MESTECIAAHAIAAWSLSTSAAYVRATLSRANASTPAGVSRSSAVVVMGLLNQPPPTVCRPPMPLCTRDPGTFGGLLARSRYARWRSLLDHRDELPSRPPKAGSSSATGTASYRLNNARFGGRVGKALWRLTVSRPPAQGRGYLTRSRYVRWRSLLDHRVRRRTRPPKAV